MTLAFRHRVAIFCGVVFALVLTIGSSALTAWRDLDQLRKHFTSAQFDRFGIAGNLQSRVLRLDARLLAYEIGRRPAIGRMRSRRRRLWMPGSIVSAHP